MSRLALLLAVVAFTGCGSSNAQPKDDPGAFAVKIVGQIVHNNYSTAWADLHPLDQKVAPYTEYVQCEERSPVIAAPSTVHVVSVGAESVAIGDGSFVESKAVHVRLGFAGGFHVVQTVHLVAERGKWKWVLPPARFRDYQAHKCPVDADSPPPAPTA